MRLLPTSFRSRRTVAVVSVVGLLVVAGALVQPEAKRPRRPSAARPGPRPQDILKDAVTRALERAMGTSANWPGSLRRVVEVRVTEGAPGTQRVEATFRADENLSPDWTRRGLLLAAADALEIILTDPACAKVSECVLRARLRLVGADKRPAEVVVFQLSLTRSAAARVAWADVRGSPDRFVELLRRLGNVWVHPAL